MLDLEFCRLYNGIRARDLMPCICRDFAMVFYYSLYSYTTMTADARL